MLENIAGKDTESFWSDTYNLSQDLLSLLLSAVSEPIAPDVDGQNNAQTKLARLLSLISQFVELTTLSTRLLKASNKDFIVEVKEAHIQLLFIIKGLNQASQKEDFVALEELIKYELKDNLTVWKIDLLPRMKRLLIT